MKTTRIKNRVILLGVITSLFVVSLFVTCAKKDKPKLVGCTSWEYKGVLYDSRGAFDECIPGLVDFDDVSFRITCGANECIQRVEVESGGTNQTILQP
ncbi:MAG: hypothetical protein ACE5HS_14570 [bacterium]